MPELVTIPAKATYYGATPEHPIRFTHAGGGTLYYDNTDAVSATTNDGNLTTGANLTNEVGVWLASAASSSTKVVVEPLPPVVSGARDTPTAALADLLAMLDQAGVITDTTTAS